MNKSTLKRLGLTACLAASLLATAACGGTSETTPSPTMSPSPTSTPAPSVPPMPTSAPMPSATSAPTTPAAVPQPMSGYSLTLSPSSGTVAVGDEFAVDVIVFAESYSGGAQCALNFNPKLLECEEVTEGPFYADWAEDHGGMTMLFPEPVIDNKAGHVTDAAVSKIGAEGGPKDSGVAFTYHFKAKSAGTASLEMENSFVSDSEGNVIDEVDLYGCEIVIQ